MKFNREPMTQPLYRPDLAPSHYHLFCSLQNHLKEKTFDSDQSIQNWSWTSFSLLKIKASSHVRFFNSPKDGKMFNEMLNIHLLTFFIDINLLSKT